MPPANFWGDTPEEEYYTSQGPVKATVYMSHGYRSDTGSRRFASAMPGGATPCSPPIYWAMAGWMGSGATSGT
ncbi:hypothetical protein RHGRI_010785 [Rhododendron griersonianum]|uniref:RNA polymerase II second largest subunit n=1 Tax=Rhododendron griersonianum TaxID=479676 RepID=A0AAV6KK75_9ERIC|nr:hypothetical protein RHGRI_010785 [Rhododendron griersonianum]